ncbi:TPA: hypothetical protein DIS60_02285 [Patescibacteria group bacterium]|nr:hypothetical protein [Patescibacteria group bacterium]
MKGLEKQSTGIKAAAPESYVIPYLTGLKGYAILGIFLIHVGEGFRHIGIYASRFVDFGKNGIVIFFIVSALTVTLSISRKFEFTSYVVRRFIRLAGPYYIVLFFTIIFKLSIEDTAVRFKSILTHLTFTNVNFIAQEYQNSILGVEWTLPIQFWYYFIIPLMYVFLRLRHSSLFLFITGIYLFFHQMLIAYVGPNGFDWSMQKFFLTYAVGVSLYAVLFLKNNKLGLLVTATLTLLYLFLNTIDVSEKKYFFALFILFTYQMIRDGVLLIEKRKFIQRCCRVLLLFDLPILIGLLLRYVGRPHNLSSIFITFWCALVIIAAKKRTTVTKILLENRYILFFGKISYSMYLWQYPVVRLYEKVVPDQPDFILRFIIVLGATILISFVSYTFVEKPLNILLHTLKKTQ